jgi:hypothetical protein
MFLDDERLPGQFHHVGIADGETLPIRGGHIHRGRAYFRLRVAVNHLDRFGADGPAQDGRMAGA